VVRDKEQRAKLQERAAREGWGAPELCAAIPRRYRAKHAHGRPMKRPATPVAGLRQLETEALVWTKRCDIVMEEVRRASLRGLTKKLRRQVEETTEVVRKLAKSARDASRELSGIAERNP